MLEFFINLKSIEHSCPPYMALRWLFMTRAGDWGEGEGGGGFPELLSKMGVRYIRDAG